MCVMNFIYMCITLDKDPRVLKIFSGAGISSVVMGASAWAVYGLAARFIGADDWLHTAVCMMAAVAVAVVVYFVSAICLKAITYEDMDLIPGGGKIAKLLHMR